MSVEKVKQTIIPKELKAEETAGKQRAETVVKDNAILTSEAIQRTMQSGEITQLADKKTKKTKDKTPVITEQAIDELEETEEGLIHLTKDTDTTPKTSTTKASTTALGYSQIAGSRYAQKKTGEVAADDLEVTENEKSSSIKGEFSNIPDSYNSAFVRDFQNDKIIRNDLTGKQRLSTGKRKTGRIEGAFNNAPSDINLRRAMSNERLMSDRLGENAKMHRERPSIVDGHAQRLQKNRTDAIKRFQQGHESNNAAKSAGLKKVKSDKTEKNFTAEKKKVEIQQKVDESTNKNLKLQNIKIKIKKRDDGSLEVVEPDIPEWINYKNGLVEQERIFREKFPEPEFSTENSKSESSVHAKWEHDKQNFLNKFGKKAENNNDTIKAVKRAMSKAREAIKEMRQKSSS